MVPSEQQGRNFQTEVLSFLSDSWLRIALRIRRNFKSSIPKLHRNRSDIRNINDKKKG